ncbi:MAG: hypothetical protein J6B17_00075 [Ruminococcus sp.]|nr:hypothetical protein [Ruminococcus sp.]
MNDNKGFCIIRRSPLTKNTGEEFTSVLEIEPIYAGFAVEYHHLSDLNVYLYINIA